MSIEIVIRDGVSVLGKKQEDGQEKKIGYKESSKFRVGNCQYAPELASTFWKELATTPEIDFEEKTFMIDEKPTKSQVPKFRITINVQNAHPAFIKIDAEFMPLRLQNKLECHLNGTCWTQKFQIEILNNSNKAITDKLLETIYRGLLLYKEKVQQEAIAVQDLCTNILCLGIG